MKHIEIKIVLFGVGILLALVCLYGCVLDLGLGGGSSAPSPRDLTLERIGSPGKIYRPLIGSGDDWFATPRKRMLLLYSTGRDQFGNPTGLSDDLIWHIVPGGVTIQCELQTGSDTIFNPPYERGRFWADGYENACIWYPTWVAPIEAISGRPFAPYPERGYPSQYCWSDDCDAGLLPADKIYIPAQSALITARAKADCVRARITCPDHGEGIYIMDVPGATPQSGNIFECTFGQSGDYEIIWEYKSETRIYGFLIPEEWFWISGSWLIEVDAQVTCKNAT